MRIRVISVTVLFAIVVLGLGVCCAQTAVEVTSDFRTWKNNTGKFSIEAKLVSVADDIVKLEKKDGRVIELPEAKLSKADRKFIEDLREKAEADNPFAGGKLGPKGSRSKSKKRQDVGTIQVNILDGQKGLSGDGWEVKIEAGELASDRALLPRKPIAIAGFGGDYGFHDRRGDPVVGPEGRWAAVSVSNPFEEKSIISVVDLQKGDVVGSAVLPEENVKAFAIDGNSRTVLTLVEESGGTPGKIEFREFDDLERPFKTWETSDFHEHDGFRPETGRFMKDGRLLTIGDNVALWDVEKNEPVFSLIYGRRGLKKGQVTLSGNQKLMAVASRQSVDLIEIKTGKLLGKIERGLSARAVSISPSGAYLAGLESSGQVWIWDLEANELAQEFHTDARSDLVWLDDRSLLGDNKYLIDVEYRVCVWKYSHESRDFVLPVDAGRFLVRRKNRLVGVKLPHKNLTDKIGDLDPEELLLVKPGDEFAIDFDLPFGSDEQRRIEESLKGRISEQGYSINRNSGLVLRGRVKEEKRKTVQVRDFGFRQRGAQSMTYQAHRSMVELLKDGKIVWTKSFYHGPSTVIRRREDESLQQHATRVSKPTPDLFLNFRIPTGLSTLPGGKPLGQSDIAFGKLR